jgi:hypothetical protein
VELRKTYQELIPPIDELLKKHGHPAIEVKPADAPQARQTSAEDAVTSTRW